MEVQKDVSIEELFQNIEDILKALENEETGLEESFQKYSEGMTLLKQCDEKIDRVEKQVLKINENGEVTNFSEE